MDIGALRVLSLGDGGTEVDEQFVACVREASFAEAMDQMADEEVARVQLAKRCDGLGCSIWRHKTRTC